MRSVPVALAVPGTVTTGAALSVALLEKITFQVEGIAASQAFGIQGRVGTSSAWVTLAVRLQTDKTLITSIVANGLYTLSLEETFNEIRANTTVAGSGLATCFVIGRAHPAGSTP